MSYDLYLEHEACDHCGRPESSCWQTNYTSNMGGVWWRSLAGTEDVESIVPPKDAEVFGAFWPLDGKRGVEAVAVLDRALAYAAEHRTKWSDSDNGWGTVAGAIAVMVALRQAFIDNPKAKLMVWR